MYSINTQHPIRWLYLLKEAGAVGYSSASVGRDEAGKIAAPLSDFLHSIQAPRRGGPEQMNCHNNYGNLDDDGIVFERDYLDSSDEEKEDGENNKGENREDSREGISKKTKKTVRWCEQEESLLRDKETTSSSALNSPLIMLQSFTELTPNAQSFVTFPPQPLHINSLPTAFSVSSTSLPRAFSSQPMQMNTDTVADSSVLPSSPTGFSNISYLLGGALELLLPQQQLPQDKVYAANCASVEERASKQAAEEAPSLMTSLWRSPRKRLREGSEVSHLSEVSSSSSRNNSAPHGTSSGGGTGLFGRVMANAAKKSSKT